MMKPFLLFILVCLESKGLHSQTLSKEEARNKYLLERARYHIFKPGENKIDLDSAARFIDSAAMLNPASLKKTSEGNILLTRSFYLKESGQRDKAKALAEQALAILENETDKNLAGEAYMELASYYNNYDDSAQLAQRIKLTKSAVNCYEQSKNIMQKAASLQMLGDLYHLKEDMNVALQYLQESLDAYNSIHYPQVQGIYCLMGFIYVVRREYTRALDKLILALRTAESVGDSTMQLCEIYNYLGEVHRVLLEKEKAIYYYGKAAEVAWKHHENLSACIAEVNGANMWVSLSKPQKALDMMRNISARYGKQTDVNLIFNIARCYILSYCLLKQYERARPYVNLLLRMVDTLALGPRSKTSYYTVAIRFFVSAGEDAQARKYLDKQEVLAKELKDFEYQAQNQKLRFSIDTTRQNYKAATAHLLEYNRLHDSATVENKNRLIGELQVKYETDKKESAIEILTKQSQLQLSQIKNGRLTRNFMIAGAVLLLLILVLVYIGYLIKKKSNRLLNKQRVQINEQNTSLQAMVRQQEHLIHEKEWLLKEIHHRVKNNLQIVMSLLNSQSAYIDNELALTAINDSQHRVHAMSLIHQKLYNAEDVSSIDMSFYIRELVSYLSDSFDASQRIRFEFNIEPLEMDVSQAVPLGLILNEAITNSIKYAFPEGKNGIIFIALVRTAPDQCLLTISDNGIGIPDQLNTKKAGSLGMSLMEGLSGDLDGHFSIEKKNGTTITVSFAYDINVKRTGMLKESLALKN